MPAPDAKSKAPMIIGGILVVLLILFVILFAVAQAKGGIGNSSGDASVTTAPAPAPAVAYTPGTVPATPTWTVVYKTDGSVDLGETATNDAFAKTLIFKRECTNCDPEHTTIFYKRLTPIPAGTSIYQLMTTTWASAGNQLNTDFKLYSSLDDLKADTGAWAFCNYDDIGIATFRDCGKTAAVGFQWNSKRDAVAIANSRSATFSVLNKP